MSDAPTSFPCPRCGTPVPAGATRCQACADRGAAETGAAPDAAGGPDAPSGNARTVVGLGCLASLLMGALLVGTAAFLLQQVQKLQVREQRREQQEAIDAERRHYDEQARRAGHAPRVTGAPSGALAALAAPLTDLSGQSVSPAATVEHGGVVILYVQGCADCLKRLASAEKAVSVARRMGLGAQLIVVHGTPEGVEKDHLPESLRGAVVLDTDGRVGTALNVIHTTAFVVDSDGQSVVYRGSPEEAAGMVPSVAQGD